MVVRVAPMSGTTRATRVGSTGQCCRPAAVTRTSTNWVPSLPPYGGQVNTNRSPMRCTPTVKLGAGITGGAVVGGAVGGLVVVGAVGGGVAGCVPPPDVPGWVVDVGPPGGTVVACPCGTAVVAAGTVTRLPADVVVDVGGGDVGVAVSIGGLTGWSVPPPSRRKATATPTTISTAAAAAAAAQGMARPIDPEPKRILPKDQNAPEIAEVSVTQEGVDKLLADRPPLWRWAVFTSVLVQRRNAVQRRLRDCALGYQPRGGMRHDGRSYSALAYQVMQEVADLVAQLEQFMLSPGFTGALKSFSEDDGAEPDAILHIANRLMDYHEGFLSQAERCLHATVNRDVIVFVQDMAAFTMCPLAGYEQFIETMCRRVAEGQELLPYAEGTVLLDDVQLAISLPDGLAERITAHIRQFSL